MTTGYIGIDQLGGRPEDVYLLGLLPVQRGGGPDGTHRDSFAKAPAAAKGLWREGFHCHPDSVGVVRLRQQPASVETAAALALERVVGVGRAPGGVTALRQTAGVQDALSIFRRHDAQLCVYCGARKPARGMPATTSAHWAAECSWGAPPNLLAAQFRCDAALQQVQRLSAPLPPPPAPPCGCQGAGLDPTSFGQVAGEIGDDAAPGDAGVAAAAGVVAKGAVRHRIRSKSKPPLCMSALLVPAPAGPQLLKRPSGAIGPGVLHRTPAPPLWRQAGPIPVACIHGEAFTTFAWYFGCNRGAQKRQVHKMCDFKVDAVQLVGGQPATLRKQGFAGEGAHQVKELLPDEAGELAAEPLPTKCVAWPSRGGRLRDAVIKIRRPESATACNLLWRVLALDLAGAGYGAVKAPLA